MNRTLKVTGSAAAVALAAAACSSGSGNSSGSGSGSNAGHDAKIVQAAYTTTTDAKTARTDMSIRIAQGSGGASQQASVTATGGVNFASEQGDFTVSLPQGMQEQIVYAHKTVYEKLPAQVRSHLGVNTPWISVDVNKIAKARTGSTLAQLQQRQPANPMDQLRYLRSVSSSVTKVGTATVDGVKTTHYRAQIDLGKQHEQTAAMRRLEKAVGSHTLPVQVWIDSRGRLRRMQLLEKVHPPNGGAPVTISVRLGLSDFGSPVSVQVPPQGRTTDVTNKLAAGH